MKKLLSVSFILFIFFIQSLAAQDKIIKFGGITLEGSVEILYQDLDDLVYLDNEAIPIQDIQSIELRFQKKLYPKRLYYYNTRLHTEIEKYAILSIVVDEDAKLYSYQGNHFKYALYSFEKLYALQDLDYDNETDRIKNLKDVLRNNLVDCITDDEISSIDYKEKDLANLISKSNRCKDGNTELILEKKTSTSITSVSLFSGLNHASHSLKTKIPKENDIVDQENVQSNSFAVGAFFQKNLFNTQKVFYELGVSFRLLNIEINSLEKNLSVENLIVNELSIGLGLNYKIFPDRKLSPEVSIGGYIWNFRGHGNIYGETSDRFPVLASKYSNLFGLGGSIQGVLKYKFQNNLHLFVSSTYLKKTEENVFTNLVPSNLRDDINDSLINNYTITLGITFSNVNE